MRSKKMHIGSIEKNKRSLVPSSPEPDNAYSYTHQESTKKLSFLNFFTLTLALLGVQFTWTVVLGQGNPVLKGLGLVGPISGLLTHPIVGGFSDRCSSRFGRRRPFIVGGVILCILWFVDYVFSFALLAFSREIGSSAPTGDGTVLSLAIAILAFGILDFAVNIVQASARTLITDMTPFSQQEEANLWASTMIHVGNILGFATASIDLKKLLGEEGNSGQFQILSGVAAVVLIITTFVTCFLYKEKVFTPMSSSIGCASFIARPFIDVWKASFRLPATILFLLFVQFFCWIGWFPVLFYSTTYIQQVVTKLSKCNEGKFCNDALLTANMGSLYMAVSAFILSILLFLMQSSRFAVPLPRLWQLGCITFTIATWCTFAITHTNTALAILGVIGISWAIGTWVPLAILGQILTKNDNAPVVLTKKGKPSDFNVFNPHLNTEESACNEAPAVPMSNGIVLGIHNVFITVPQIFASFLGLAIVKITGEETRAFVPGSKTDYTGWLLRAGGIGSFIAFFMIFWYIRILKRASLY